jgi:integrase
MGRRLTDSGIAALKPKAKAYLKPDLQTPGLYVRVLPSGSKAFVVVIRHGGKQIWKTLKTATGIDDARERAAAEMAALTSTPATPTNTFAHVADQWFKRHVEKQGFLSADQTRRLMYRHLRRFDSMDFESVRRGDVAALLDHIEDTSGARTADAVLNIISGICHWYEKRNENYSSPIVKGMGRYNAKQNARARILTDDEIRELWNASGQYWDVLRLSLLTGSRREKVATMKWSDLDGNIWTIAREAREKNNAGTLTLPKLAMDIINRQPRFATNPHIFAGRKAGFTSWAYWKPKVDWTAHDLRRTARSLMSRAGVRPDIAERVLGHAIKGVEGTYDRHSFEAEKAHALRALAGLITNILAPEGSKVLQLRK